VCCTTASRHCRQKREQTPRAHGSRPRRAARARAGAATSVRDGGRACLQRVFGQRGLVAVAASSGAVPCCACVATSRRQGRKQADQRARVAACGGGLTIGLATGVRAMQCRPGQCRRAVSVRGRRPREVRSLGLTVGQSHGTGGQVVPVLCGPGDRKGSALAVCVRGRLPRACVCGGVLMCLCVGGGDAMRCVYAASASWTAAARACVGDGTVLRAVPMRSRG
jgi:hypothetical protein